MALFWTVISSNRTSFLWCPSTVLNYMIVRSRIVGCTYGSLSTCLQTNATASSTFDQEALFQARTSQNISIHFFFLVCAIFLHFKPRDFRFGMLGQIHDTSPTFILYSLPQMGPVLCIGMAWWVTAARTVAACTVVF